MQVRITPSRASGRVCAPPSKSVAHRLLILSAFTEGVSVISNLPLCEDVLATLDCLRSLGIEYRLDRDTVTVWGKSIRSLSPQSTLFCRESASTLRFLLPVAILTGKEVRFSGSKSLLSRPLGEYEELFGMMGWVFKREDDLLVVQGDELPDTVKLRADVSSQFITGILLAYATSGKSGRLELLSAPSSKPYIDLTIDALKQFGIQAKWETERTITLSASPLSPISARVEGDFSAAANLEAFHFLGGEVVIDGLYDASLQADRVYKELFSLLEREGACIDLDICPDLGPILFALAAQGHGASFTSCSRLRTKESDRVETTALELSKLGAELIVHGERVEVIAHPLHTPSIPLSSHGDHRVAMALIPLLSLVGGDITGVEAINKSFPAYLACIRALGIEAEEI